MFFKMFSNWKRLKWNLHSFTLEGALHNLSMWETVSPVWSMNTSAYCIGSDTRRQNTATLISFSTKRPVEVGSSQYNFIKEYMSVAYYIFYIKDWWRDTLEKSGPSSYPSVPFNILLFACRWRYQAVVVGNTHCSSWTLRQLTGDWRKYSSPITMVLRVLDFYTSCIQYNVTSPHVDSVCLLCSF